ncbi:MAG: glycosyltransferase family 2 protein [Actinomycetota bacterium]|nr:glycosyltransferase family 2 protein [Actinomycetota bacterium]
MQHGSDNSVVTVVVPCFNYGHFLPEALHSLAVQSGGPPRVVVVDDGSTDPHTHQVLDDLEGDGGEVEVLRQSNQGVSRACNAGLDKAQTEYALMLSADDRLFPGALGLLRGMLEADPALGYAYGQAWFFGTQSGVLKLPPWDPWRLLFRNIVTGTALIRTELLRATGGYDPAFRHYEDWELWIHALSLGWKGQQLDEPAFHYRRHAEAKGHADRRGYRQTRRLLRRKHASLYDNLDRIASASRLSRAERLLYRYVWAPRPWPAAAERALYSLIWSRGNDPVTGHSDA